MKEVILNNQLLTMSSREIATLCNKRHDNVVADIRKMCEQLEIDVLKFQGIYKDSQNREQTEYLLDKETCLCLVAGYNAKLRMAIIKRWQELENQQPKLPQTYIEALECLLESEKQKLALQIELHTAQPKINHYDKVVERHTLITATQVGQKLGMSAQKLNVILEGFKVYNMAVKRGRAFAQWFIDGGLGEMKQTDGGFSQPLFTTKGEAWVVEKFISEGIV